MRVGIGYDVHAYGDGDHVTLGGVRIAHTRGVIAHSDGDVALHALCDALLGAMALGDIGEHFPDSDPRWKGADSRPSLRHCGRSRGNVLHPTRGLADSPIAGGRSWSDEPKPDVSALLVSQPARRWRL